MELLLHSIKLDWPVLLPILICSILVVAVVINRFQFYKKNKRDVVLFIPKLQKELAKNNLQGAQSVAENCGGVIGEVTEEKVKIVQDADAIYREEIANAGLDKNINQYFAVLTNTRSVGVMGDERTYDYTVAIRAVTTDDFMTADWARIPYELLDKISGRIVNEVKHINRIVYDITSKPPATVEWE